MGKWKTAINMASLGLLMGGSHMIKEADALVGGLGIDAVTIEHIDAQIALAAKSGLFAGVIGTIMCWFDYNAKLNKLVK